MAKELSNDNELTTLEIRHFSLRFERVSRTFYGGETVKGFVDIDEKAQECVEDVALHFRGETLACWQDDQSTIRAHKCHWQEEVNLRNVQGKGFSRNWHFTPKNYKNDGFCLCWSSQDNARKLVKPMNATCDFDSIVFNGNGINSFTFEVTLPEKDLPSSFESKLGAIRYWVKATVQPGSINCQQPFTVLEKINMNSSKYQKPQSSFTEKVLTWMCFRYGGISLNASIDRSGYCPGEAIAVSCRGNNKANREMGGMKARLIQTVRYSTSDKKESKECESILRAIGGNRIQRNHTRVWQNQLLWIPAIPPTNNMSENISVAYHLQVSMQIPNETDLCVKIPVTIGTVPLKQEEAADYTTVQNLSKFEKCTDGSDCFNRSSKRFRFPMQPFIPSTCVVQHYLHKQNENNGFKNKTKPFNDERQPLLQRHS